MNGNTRLKTVIRFRELAPLFKAAADGWQNDKASRLGAALAYYMMFSIGPLLLLTLAAAGTIFGEEAAQGRLLGEIRDLTGEEGAKAIQAMLASRSNQDAGAKATLIGTTMLLFGATGMFGALQDALNTVWEVQPKLDRGLGDVVRERFLSFTMMLGTAFLLLVSLIVSAVLAAISALLGSGDVGLAGEAINSLLSFIVVTLLFAMIFKFLPDALVAWQHVWFGAAFTSLLFAIGKLAIGLYIGQSALASAYGAAGSLAALLVWLYYSSQIFLFGVELTKAHAQLCGTGIIPAANADPVTSEAKHQQGMATQADEYRMTAAHSCRAKASSNP